MWDKPQLLNAIADLLYVAAAAALLTALVVWAVRVPSLPIKQVVVKEELRQIKRDELEQALAGRFAGNFFSINLENVRSATETLPWVRHAQVRRKWSSQLELQIEEHQPVARWEDAYGHAGRNELVNSFGEVFVAVLVDSEAEGLPLVYGPTGSASEILHRYVEFARILAPTGQKPVQVRLSPRLAWQIRLNDGMLLELGREQSKSPVNVRLARFVEVYSGAVAKRPSRPSVVDLRYPNGFALRGKG